MARGAGAPRRGRWARAQGGRIRALTEALYKRGLKASASGGKPARLGRHVGRRRASRAASTQPWPSRLAWRSSGGVKSGGWVLDGRRRAAAPGRPGFRASIGVRLRCAVFKRQLVAPKRQRSSARVMLPIKSADLCSGLGLHAWWSQGFAKPAIYCEICPKARALLLSCQRRGVIPEAPVHDDICTLKLEPGTEFMTCSWPCQARGGSTGAAPPAAALRLTHRALSPLSCAALSPLRHPLRPRGAFTSAVHVRPRGAPPSAAPPRAGQQHRRKARRQRRPAVRPHLPRA